MSRAEAYHFVMDFYSQGDTAFSAVNGPGVVIAFCVQLSVCLGCTMIIVHYLYISCGCTKLEPLFKPRKSLGIDPSFFNCTKMIADMKLVGLAPVMLFQNELITFLMALYLQLYTKPLLAENEHVSSGILALQNCFDDIVQTDLAFLKSENEKLLASSQNVASVVTAFSITQIVLLSVCVVNMLIMILCIWKF